MDYINGFFDTSEFDNATITQTNSTINERLDFLAYFNTIIKSVTFRASTTTTTIGDWYGQSLDDIPNPALGEVYIEFYTYDKDKRNNTYSLLHRTGYYSAESKLSTDNEIAEYSIILNENDQVTVPMGSYGQITIYGRNFSGTYSWTYVDNEKVSHTLRYSKSTHVNKRSIVSPYNLQAQCRDGLIIFMPMGVTSSSATSIGDIKIEYSCEKNFEMAMDIYPRPKSMDFVKNEPFKGYTDGTPLQAWKIDSNNNGYPWIFGYTSGGIGNQIY